MRYAADTKVSTENSRAEIERTLQRYGASSFISGWDVNKAMLGFIMNDRQIRFILDMPDQSEFQFTPVRGVERSDEDRYKAWEQATRQRWRALALAVKAKLEAVEAGISTFESEFLAHIVLPNGQTMAEFAAPQIAQWYKDGKVPRQLLPGVPADAT